MKTALIILFLFLAATIVHSGTTSVNPRVTKQFNSVADSSKTKTNMTDSEAYKLLYDNAKESSNRIISIIQWAIGLSIAFLIAIATGQFLFNYRINKKEIEYINKDIDEKFAELRADLLKDLGNTSKTHEDSINNQFHKVEETLSQKIIDQSAKQSKISELSEKMINKDIEILRKDFESEIKKLTIDIEKNAGDIWKLKGVESNALSRFISTALLKIEMKHEVKYILDDIIDILAKLEEIHSFDYTELSELITKMGSLYPEKKTKIEELYKDKPVYKYLDNPIQYFPSNPLLAGLNLTTNKIYIKNKPKEI